MSNPLFSQMMGGMPQQTQTPTNNMSNLIQRFQQFKNMFNGDPRQQVQQLINSGRVSQAQYNQAVQMANQLQNLLR